MYHGSALPRQLCRLFSSLATRQDGLLPAIKKAQPIYKKSRKSLILSHNRKLEMRRRQIIGGAILEAMHDKDIAEAVRLTLSRLVTSPHDRAAVADLLHP